MQPALSNCGLIRSCKKQFEIAAYCDAPEPFQLGTQDPGTENMEWLINLHNYVMADLIIVLVVIIGLLTGLFTQKHGITLNFTKTKAIFSSNRIFSHSKFLEIFWTVLPAFTLLVIASPTFNLLYALDDLADPGLILKITAHQWYWSYEYALSLNDIINFDAYLIKTEDLHFGSLRLLETTERLKLPYSTHVRLLITSADVLHSWTIPSFGIKVDACPGRLTQASIFIKRAGLYFGQCSEICGVNHGFMPIVVKSLNPSSIFASDSIEPTPAELPLGVEGHTNAFFIATHTSTQ
jgi:cytochrome c oxidase subunit 2